MVPSRSRKTAGRRGPDSGRTHLHARHPVTGGGFDRVWRDASHTPVIGRATAQKTGAAVWLFLNDAATRRDGCGSKGIGWPKDSHNGETDGRGDVHRARVISNEEMALRKKRGQIGDRSFPGEIDRWVTHASCNRGRNSGFRGRAK